MKLASCLAHVASGSQMPDLYGHFAAGEELPFPASVYF